MNYYPFHIGDYAVHTRHLSLMEDLAYRRLLDLYYTRETCLPADAVAVCRLIGMRDQQAEVETVLAEFFTLTDAGWAHARCDAEITKAQAAAERARTNGAGGGRPRKTQQEPTNNPVGFEQEPTANPVETKSKAPNPKTNTQYQINPPTPRGGPPDGVSDAVWQDFQKTRTKRAPITPTALEGIKREALKAGIPLEAALRMACERGWRSFKAAWVDGDKQPERPSGPDPALEKIKRDASLAAAPSLETLAKLAELRKPRTPA